MNSLDSGDDLLLGGEMVSVIMPTYNSIDTLGETIASVLKQSYSNWELLVTDDCSTDGTWEKLLVLASEDSRIKPHRLKVNSGAAVARNASISRASGRCIAFLDSDDLWLENKLKKQIAFMADVGAVFCYTSYVVRQNGSIRKSKEVDGYDHESVDYWGMLKKQSTLGCSTVMLDASRLTGIEMPLIRTAQDYATWLRILRENKCRAYCLREPLTVYTIRSGSISRNKFKKAMRQWQVYREIEGIDVFRSMYFMLFYAYRAVFRR